MRSVSSSDRTHPTAAFATARYSSLPSRVPYRHPDDHRLEQDRGRDPCDAPGPEHRTEHHEGDNHEEGEELEDGLEGPSIEGALWEGTGSAVHGPRSSRGKIRVAVPHDGGSSTRRPPSHDAHNPVFAL